MTATSPPDRGPAVEPPSGDGGGSAATIAWPALGMLMVASVGSVAQLSDSATFGWGAVTVYLIPAVMFLIPVGLVSAELATSNRGVRSWVAPSVRPMPRPAREALGAVFLSFTGEQQVAWALWG